jgi:hypothetical protein
MYSTQTVDGVAGRLGFLKFSLGDLHFDSEYLDQIKSVTPLTLKRLVQEYLTHDRMSVVVLQPKEEKTYDFTSIAKKLETLAPFPAIKTKAKTKKDALEPELITTPSGLKVAYF